MAQNTITVARQLAQVINPRLSVGRKAEWVTVDGRDYPYFLTNGKEVVKTFASRAEQCEYLRTLASI